MCGSSDGRRQRGLTLLEVVLFIVVVGIAGVIVLTTLSSPLTDAGTQLRAVTATQVAQARMEIVLGQKRRRGFPGSDPCNPCDQAGEAPALCQLPTGWCATTSFEPWAGEDPDDFQVIVVTARSPDGSTFSIRSLVARLGD